MDGAALKGAPSVCFVDEVKRGEMMQQKVEQFVAQFGLECGAQIRFMDLVSEVGELGKEIVKGSNYGREPYENTPAAADEAGDCLFSLLALCAELGIDAQTALEGALAKYRRRMEKKGDAGSGR